MLIDIHDVGHGACAVITFSNGKRMMIDAGMRSDPFWSPSIEYFKQTIELLVIGNLDEDHVANLPYVFENVGLKAHFSNPTVDASALAWLKRDGGMGRGVSAAHRMLEVLGPRHGVLPDLPADIWTQAFWNSFGGSFHDTNNLSVATFVGRGSFAILFGGDLEEAGWRGLLSNPAFRACLTRVKILVASHHGRENGCCAEIFDYCKPEVVVISDYEHRHASQQTLGFYRNRVTGIPDLTRPWANRLMPQPTRSVLTTRDDGSLKIEVQPSGAFVIVPERFHNSAPARTSLLASIFENPLTGGLPAPGY